MPVLSFSGCQVSDRAPVSAILHGLDVQIYSMYICVMQIYWIFDYTPLALSDKEFFYGNAAEYSIANETEHPPPPKNNISYGTMV